MATSRNVHPAGGPRRLTGMMNFIGHMDERPRYHANDTSRDVLLLESHAVEIEDARGRADPPTLDRNGFTLVSHRSVMADFRDPRQVARVYAPEIRTLLLELSGADEVVVNPRGVLRFGERSADCGALDNSRPARFVHIDVSDATARAFSHDSAPPGAPEFRRAAHYNVWRVLTPPPQDVPLAVCDARSVAPADLVAADAVFDAPDQPEWSFEGLVVRYNPTQCWCCFSDMHPGEALVFKTNDTDPVCASQVPHGAFDDPECPPDASPRVSIEMRCIAYWY